MWKVYPQIENLAENKNKSMFVVCNSRRNCAAVHERTAPKPLSEGRALASMNADAAFVAAELDAYLNEEGAAGPAWSGIPSRCNADGGEV